MYCVLGEGGKIRSSSCVHKKPFPSITNSSSIGVQEKISRIEGKQCQSQIPPHGCNSIPPTNHTYHGNVMKELQNSYQYDNRLQSGQSSCTQVGGSNLDYSVEENYYINFSLLKLGGTTLAHCSCRRQDRRALNARYRRTMDRC